MVLKHMTSCLGKDHGILKIIFTLLCSFLIANDWYIAFIEKPTLTREIKTTFSKEDIPEVTLCPEPAIDFDEMISLGYSDLYAYKAGIIDFKDWKKLSWSSNQTMDVKEVAEKLSPLKSEKDCPFAMAMPFWKNITNITLTRALFPYHFCCKIDAKDVDKNFHELFIILQSDFRLILSDRTLSSPFNIHTKNIYGEHIIRSEFGANFYKIKIAKEIHMEEDPNYPCKNYARPGDYDECLEKDFTSRIVEILNCTPPWLTNNASLWCQGVNILKKEDEGKFFKLIKSVLLGTAHSEKCPNPCLVIKYDVNHVGFMQERYSGIYLVFDENVSKTVSGLQVTALSLLSRFGGIVGLGKNLLWIVVLLISSVGFFRDSLKQV